MLLQSSTTYTTCAVHRASGIRITCHNKETKQIVYKQLYKEFESNAVVTLDHEPSIRSYAITNVQFKLCNVSLSLLRLDLLSLYSRLCELPSIRLPSPDGEHGSEGHSAERARVLRVNRCDFHHAVCV